MYGLFPGRIACAVYATPIRTAKHPLITHCLCRDMMIPGCRRGYYLAPHISTPSACVAPVHTLRSLCPQPPFRGR